MSMSPAVQPLHIFRKDAIHLWPETIISIALLFAFAWAEVQTWAPSDNPNGKSGLAILLIVLVWFVIMLLLVVWLVLTSRLVHDEELVGDRQFWITRPYTWYSLLGSKVLYLIVLVGLPLIAVQMWLLHHAGMYPTQVIPGLLKNLLVIFAVFLLPLVAIAAVTATFVRYMLSAIAGVIYAVVIYIVTQWNWSEKLDAPYVSHAAYITILVLMLVALFIQYALRKTKIARIVLLTLPLLYLVFALLTPSNFLTERRYPDVAAGKLTFSSDTVPPHSDAKLVSIEHKNIITLPVQVQLNNQTDDSFVEVQRIRMDIDGPNGFHYSSDWAPDQTSLISNSSAEPLPIALPEKVFQQIRTQSVSMHIYIGVQTFTADKPYTVTASEKPFPIPGHATCTISADGGLECHFPFTISQPMLVTATVHNGDCQTPGQFSAPASGRIDPSLPWPLHFSPVTIARTSLSVGNKVPLCPGTPTTFKTAVEGAYGRMHLDIPAITLDPYALHIPSRHAQQEAPPATNQ